MDTKTKYIPFYRTHDFEEALILYAGEAVLDCVEWDYKGEIGEFVFEDEEKCQEILSKHKRKKLMLNSMDVLFALKQVKTELYKNR